MVRFLRDSIEKKGCPIDASNFVKCVPAPDAEVLGGFDVATKKIFINSVTATDQKTVTRTVLHEMIHAYDHCRVYLDYGDCRQLACTEVRQFPASNFQ